MTTEKRTVEFQKIESQKVYRQVVEQILGMIASGDLQPGDKLPSERELVKLLGVSRPSVREALAALELMGVVGMQRGQGIFVSPRFHGEEAAYRALSYIPGEDSPLDILEARRALERHTARLAAARAQDHHVETMRTHLAMMGDQIAEGGMFEMEHDRNFHLSVADAAQSMVLYRLTHVALDLTRQRLWLILRDRSHEYPGQPEKYHSQHEEISESIAAGNADRAEQAVLAHIDSVEADIFG